LTILKKFDKNDVVLEKSLNGTGQQMKGGKIHD